MFVHKVIKQRDMDMQSSPKKGAVMRDCNRTGCTHKSQTGKGAATSHDINQVCN